MKHFILLGALFLAGVQSKASTSNPYAPTLNSVIALYDPLERTYSPFLYNSIMGEALDMKMDASCAHIKVAVDKSIICISNMNQNTVVGKLDGTVGQSQGWIHVAIRFFNNVQIVEDVQRVAGRPIYSYRLVVKNH